MAKPSSRPSKSNRPSARARSRAPEALIKKPSEHFLAARMELEDTAAAMRAPGVPRDARSRAWLDLLKIEGRPEHEYTREELAKGLKNLAGLLRVLLGPTHGPT